MSRNYWIVTALVIDSAIAACANDPYQPGGGGGGCTSTMFQSAGIGCGSPPPPPSPTPTPSATPTQTQLPQAPTWCWGDVTGTNLNRAIYQRDCNLVEDDNFAPSVGHTPNAVLYCQQPSSTCVSVHYTDPSRVDNANINFATYCFGLSNDDCFLHENGLALNYTGRVYVVHGASNCTYPAYAPGPTPTPQTGSNDPIFNGNFAGTDAVAFWNIYNGGTDTAGGTGYPAFNNPFIDNYDRIEMDTFKTTIQANMKNCTGGVQESTDAVFQGQESTFAQSLVHSGAGGNYSAGAQEALEFNGCSDGQTALDNTIGYSLNCITPSQIEHKPLCAH